MSGEITGTLIVLNNTTGALVGQGDMTHTYGGTLVEISNKSFGDAVTYLDGANANKQHIFSGDFTYNNNAQFRKARSDAFNGTQDTYTMEYTGSGTATNEKFVGLFVPTGLSDALPKGVKVSTTMAFNSSGPITITAATDS